MLKYLYIKQLQKCGPKSLSPPLCFYRLYTNDQLTNSHTERHNTSEYYCDIMTLHP